MGHSLCVVVVACRHTGPCARGRGSGPSGQRRCSRLCSWPDRLIHPRYEWMRPAPVGLFRNGSGNTCGTLIRYRNTEIHKNSFRSMDPELVLSFHMTLTAADM